MQKCDVSNDVDGIKKDQAQVVGNGEIEGKISPVVAVKHKSVKDTSDARSQLDVNAASPEEPVREKHDTSGSSSSPVKRKQVRETSDSETEESGSPTKKPRSEVADHFSDHSTKMSDEDMDSSSKTSPKKQKLKKKKPALDDDDEEELERMFGSASVQYAFAFAFGLLFIGMLNSVFSIINDCCVIIDDRMYSF